MKIFYKILSLTLALALTAFSFSACKGKKEETVNEETKDEAEINARYDELMNNGAEEELLPEDYNPIVNNFTTADFQFTLEDDTLAFNLAENSYAKITPAGASFGFHSETSPADYFEGSFKNAKGVSIKSGKDALIASYKLSDANIFSDDGGNSVFAFATDNNYEYTALSSEDAKKLFEIYQNSITSSQNAGENVMTQYGAYSSVAFVCINCTSDGILNQYEMHRFEKISE